MDHGELPCSESGHWSISSALTLLTIRGFSRFPSLSWRCRNPPHRKQMLPIWALLQVMDFDHLNHTHPPPCPIVPPLHSALQALLKMHTVWIKASNSLLCAVAYQHVFGNWFWTFANCKLNLATVECMYVCMYILLKGVAEPASVLCLHIRILRALNPSPQNKTSGIGL